MLTVISIKERVKKKESGQLTLNLYGNVSISNFSQSEAKSCQGRIRVEDYKVKQNRPEMLSSDV